MSQTVYWIVTVGIFWLLPIPVIGWLERNRSDDEISRGGSAAYLFGWFGVLFRASRLPKDSGSVQAVGVLLGVIGVAGAIGLGAYSISQAKSSGPSAASVASKIGAFYCDKSGYAIIIKATGAREQIYDCQMNAAGNPICVTDTNGVANDETATVKLLFASTLGSGKPACLS